jgi:hypothetical protein
VSWGNRSRRSSAEELEKIGVKDQTEDAQQQHAADSEVNTAETAAQPESAAPETFSTTAFIATVFNVTAGIARSPFHKFNPMVRE